MENLSQKFEPWEDKLRGELGALWENQVPKDESHIPCKLSMEENLSFDGEFSFFKLQNCSSMEVGERVLGREQLGL